MPLDGFKIRSAKLFVPVFIGALACFATPETASASAITRNFQITIYSQTEYYLDTFNQPSSSSTSVNFTINANFTVQDPGYYAPVQTYFDPPYSTKTLTDLLTNGGFTFSTVLDASLLAFNTHGPINHQNNGLWGYQEYLEGAGYDYGFSNNVGYEIKFAFPFGKETYCVLVGSQKECAQFVFQNYIQAYGPLFSPVSQPETYETVASSLLDNIANSSDVELYALDHAYAFETDCSNSSDPNCDQTHWTRYAGRLYRGKVTAVYADVPEPSTIVLMAMALLSLFGFGLMRHRQAQ